jgi:hypothetical protein
MGIIYKGQGQCKSNMTWLNPWPSQCLTRIALHDAHRLARDVRQSVQKRDPQGPMTDLRGVCRAGGFRIVERELSGSEGGVEAALLPRSRNNFLIWVDPTPRGGWDKIRPRMRPDVRRHRLRFRVAHEIAHSFFFLRDGGQPKRVLPDSPEQEGFADAFASALLVPPEVAVATGPTPAGVLDLHERYDVSLQVAVRAVAETQPGVSAILAYWHHDPTGAPEEAKLQWCTHDMRQNWRDAVRKCRYGPGEDGLIVPSRRQLLWISCPSSRRAALARP